MLTKLIISSLAIIDKPLMALWRSTGWDCDNSLPAEDKFMLAMAPHTSFRDYINSIPVAIHVRRRPRIMMKKELLNNPIYGWFLKLTGGFGVDRSRSKNVVQTIIKDIQKEKRLIMIIAPEGTRERTDDWKTGFYHIAVGAQLPLVLVYVDYQRKRVGFSEVYQPTGDIINDFQWMSDFFEAHGSPYYPDQFALPDMDKLKARVEARNNEPAEAPLIPEQQSLITP